MRIRKLSSLLVVLSLFLLIFSGCEKKDEQATTGTKKSVPKEIPTLKIGYVGHDHQSALYVAAESAEKTKKDCGIYLKEVEHKKFYDLMKDNQKIANVELIKAGGGSKMPTMLAQGSFEVGFGGIAAIAFFKDKGEKMKVISPLQMKGDMLVLKPSNEANNWAEFVTWVKETKEPIKIGYKNPVAVAKLIFEEALRAEGISFTGDQSDNTKDIQMVLLKGEKNLVPGLKNDLVQGYVSNNPWCEKAQQSGVGKIVADLNTLPPGTFVDHPCCCIGASDAAIAEKGETIKEFLKLILLATNYINEDPATTSKQVAKWTGMPVAVETASLPTSGFSTKTDKKFLSSMHVWVDAMNRVGKLKGGLKNLPKAETEAKLANFALLDQAAKELKDKGIETRF